MTRRGRGYSWPPFEPGNMAHLKHGAWSPSLIEPRAAELVEAALAETPYLTEPRYTASVWAWARAEARILLLSDYLDRVGLLDDRGRPRGAVDTLLRCESLAAKARTVLGLDPLSRARLGRDVTAARVDMARLMADAVDETSDDPDVIRLPASAADDSDDPAALWDDDGGDQ